MAVSFDVFVIVSLFRFEVTPTAGANEGTSRRRQERGCHRILGGP
jgi:hypothetical protein